MTKRLLEIEDELLEQARIVLGTPTMAATVREALRRAVEVDPGEEYVRLLASLEPAERADMWG